jgi:hypothetical protein
MHRRTFFLLSLCLCTARLSLQAQEFKLFDRQIQIHGFASQAFVYTGQNNWLTMHSRQGSGAFTDFGANVSMQVTDKLRIGAQIYDRNIGNLGEWHPSVDWAVADYRFKPWLGIRGGKVKTVIGLYNDTQDLDFLHPFALLPQSIYPVDLRDSTIAHTGGDVYGNIPLEKRLGTLSYTGYAGQRQDSKHGGYPYLLKSPPTLISFSSFGGLQYGGDLRWTTPVKGLLVGLSRLNEDIKGYGTIAASGSPMPYFERSIAQWTNQYYGQYTWEKLQIDSEYRRYWLDYDIHSVGFRIQTDQRGWYVAGAYRVAKRLQLGSYYSSSWLFSPAVPGFTAARSGHIYDKVITGRVDLTRFMNVKLEGHFMDGYGVPGYYPSGFYIIDNPQGLKPNTNALVVKTGFNF